MNGLNKRGVNYVRRWYFTYTLELPEMYAAPVNLLNQNGFFTHNVISIVVGTINWISLPGSHTCYIHICCWCCCSISSFMLALRWKPNDNKQNMLLFTCCCILWSNSIDTQFIDNTRCDRLYTTFYFRGFCIIMNIQLRIRKWVRNFKV